MFNITMKCGLRKLGTVVDAVPKVGETVWIAFAEDGIHQYFRVTEVIHWQWNKIENTGVYEAPPLIIVMMEEKEEDSN